MSKKAVAYPVKLEKKAYETVNTRLKRAAWQLNQLDALAKCFAPTTLIALPQGKAISGPPTEVPGECDPMPEKPITEISVKEVAGWVRKARLAVRGASQVLASAAKSKTASKQR